MVNLKWKKDKNGKYISGRSFGTREGAERARKKQTLANAFKVTRSRRDKRFRIKID